jgi:hypothetical protein
MPSARVALLSEKDVVQLPQTDRALHVTVFNRVRVGPVSEEFIGRGCLVCRSPFRQGQVVYVCYRCGDPMHLEAEDVPEKQRLRCAAVTSECRSCGSAVVLQEGYTYIPEL